jgi:hypothetical protein
MGVATSTAILGAGALGAGAGVYGSSRAAKTQANAARDAANAQVEAADRAANAQREMFERQVELQAPFRQAGLTAQNRLMTLLGLEGGEAGAPDFGRYSRDFGTADFEADPGYGFRMSEGMKAIERSAAARGGLLSGSTLKGVQRFGQDLASSEYGNAYNRFYAMRNAQLNPLQSLTGQGQTSANTLTNAAGDFGKGLASTYMSMGNVEAAGATGAGQARASGYVGGANALTGALQSGMGNYLTASYLARMPGPGVNAYAAQPGTFYGPAGYGSGISQFDV